VVCRCFVYRRALHCSGYPTVSRARYCCRPASHPCGAPPQELLWFNMREEPVVYINGRPFVLREQVGAAAPQGRARGAWGPASTQGLPPLFSSTLCVCVPYPQS
jgi:hypothetical protein